MDILAQPYDYVRRNVTSSPDAIAATDGIATYSWRTLDAIVRTIAAELRRVGVKPGDVVGIALPPRLAFVATWAVYHEGAITFPFTASTYEPNKPPVVAVLSERPIPSAPGVNVVVSPAWLRVLPALAPTITPESFPGLEAPLRYMATSGTTGSPLVVRFSVESSLRRAVAVYESARSHTAILSLMSTRTEGGFLVMLASAMFGKPYLIPEDPRRCIHLLQSFEVDTLRGSPAQLATIARLLESMRVSLPALRLVLPVGGRLPPAVRDKLRRLTAATVGNFYASTEVTPVAVRWDDSDDPTNAGRVVTGCDVEILDEHTAQPVANGELGLIAIRSEWMASGYPFDADATQRQFRNGWFVPNDFGRLDGDTLVVLGRISDFINSGGNKTDPAVIEDAYGTHAIFDDCAAFGLPDRDGIERIALAYVAPTEFSTTYLTSLVSDELKGRTPRHFFRVEEIPRGDGMGKVQRSLLVERVARR